MTTFHPLEPIAGVAAFVCALVVFLGAALDGPEDAPAPASQIVGSAR